MTLLSSTKVHHAPVSRTASPSTALSCRRTRLLPALACKKALRFVQVIRISTCLSVSTFCMHFCVCVAPVQGKGHKAWIQVIFLCGDHVVCSDGAHPHALQALVCPRQGRVCPQTSRNILEYHSTGRTSVSTTMSASKSVGRSASWSASSS